MSSRLILHRLPKGGPANFTQLDIDYCCHPLVKLQDLAQEAVLLNPSLTLRTDLDWTEVEAKLAYKTYQEVQDRKVREANARLPQTLMARLLDSGDTNATS